MIYTVVLTGGKKLEDVDLWSIIPILCVGDGFDVFDHNKGLIARAIFDGSKFIVMTAGGTKNLGGPVVDTPEKAYDRAMGVIR